MSQPTTMSGTVQTLSSSDKVEPIDLDLLAKRDEDKKLVAWINDQYSKCKTARSAYERQWYINLAFYFGRQNIVVTNTAASPSGFRLEVPKAPSWRVRQIHNKIRPIVRKYNAKLMSQKPSAFIMPGSSDDDDIIAARAGETIWESLAETTNYQDVLRRALFWSTICGDGYIQSYWDAGKLDSNGMLGDIEIASVTPFHILVPDLTEELLENQPFLIHAATKSVEWVKAKYTHSATGEVLRPNTISATDILDDSFLNLGVKANSNNDVLIKEVWIKPRMHPLFPDGGLVTCVGDQILQSHKGWPYKNPKFPYHKIGAIESGRFYSEAIVTDLIPIQREYNRTVSQILENKNLMSRPKLTAAKGSIDAKRITSEPGQVIEYLPGMPPPAPLGTEPLPAVVMQSLELMQRDMDDISSQHDVSKGSAPAGVTAGTAINYLQEADDTTLSRTVAEIETATKGIGQQVLGYVAEFWDAPRTVKLIGEDGAFDAQVFKGADLRGNTDLRVEGGSAMPTSKSAKQALIMDLIKQGLVDPKTGLESLEMGGLAKLYNDLNIDLRQAQRENLKMRVINPQQLNPAGYMQPQGPPQGPPDPNAGPPVAGSSPGGPASGPLNTGLPNSGPPDPNAGPAPDQMGAMPGEPQLVGAQIVPTHDWDNHEVHITVHNNYRKSQAFESLDPLVQSEFEAHVQQHKAALMQAQLQQAMGGGMQPGGDPNSQSAAPELPGNSPGPQGQPGLPPTASPSQGPPSN